MATNVPKDSARTHSPRDEFSDHPLVSVVVPVFNEVHTIVTVLEKLAAIPLRTQVIIVDDGSTDGTARQLRDFAEHWASASRLDNRSSDVSVGGIEELILCTHDQNRGKGAALRSGFAKARGEFIIVQDADLEYNPADIPNVLAPLLKNEADVVFGSRFHDLRRASASWAHHWGNRLLTKAVNIMMSLQLTDMETCYKAFRADVVQQLQLRQNGFGIEPELTAKLARRKCRIVEVPIEYHPRGYHQGKKIRTRDFFQALYCIVRYGMYD